MPAPTKNDGRDYENGRISNFQRHVTLILTLDRVIWHTTVHHISTSTYTPNFIQNRTNFLWTDRHTYGQTLRPALLGWLRVVAALYTYSFSIWSMRTEGLVSQTESDMRNNQRKSYKKIYKKYTTTFDCRSTGQFMRSYYTLSNVIAQKFTYKYIMLTKNFQNQLYTTWFRLYLCPKIPGLSRIPDLFFQDTFVMRKCKWTELNWIYWDKLTAMKSLIDQYAITQTNIHTYIKPNIHNIPIPIHIHTMSVSDDTTLTSDNSTVISHSWVNRIHRIQKNQKITRKSCTWR